MRIGSPGLKRFISNRLLVVKEAAHRGTAAARATCVACLLAAGTVFSQDGGVPQGEEPSGDLTITASPVREPDFQPYVFWAYGLVCLLLFLFTLWTVAESRKLTTRLKVLEDRFQRAHPQE